MFSSRLYPFSSCDFQQQATPVRTPPQPLDGPPSFTVVSGPNSGQAVIRGKQVPKAVGYSVRSAPLGSDGKPGTWTEQPSAAIRSITVIGLTPGATYAFQVRALGRLCNTDWSDAATRIGQ